MLDVNPARQTDCFIDKGAVALVPTDVNRTRAPAVRTFDQIEIAIAVEIDRLDMPRILARIGPQQHRWCKERRVYIVVRTRDPVLDRRAVAAGEQVEQPVAIDVGDGEVVWKPALNRKIGRHGKPAGPIPEIDITRSADDADDIQFVVGVEVSQDEIVVAEDIRTIDDRPARQGPGPVVQIRLCRAALTSNDDIQPRVAVQVRDFDGKRLAERQYWRCRERAVPVAEQHSSRHCSVRPGSNPACCRRPNRRTPS